MTSLPFPLTPRLALRRAPERRSTPKAAAIARGESLLMRFVRSVAQARIDWATGGRA